MRFFFYISQSHYTGKAEQLGARFLKLIDEDVLMLGMMTLYTSCTMDLYIYILKNPFLFLEDTFLA